MNSTGVQLKTLYRLGRNQSQFICISRIKDLVINEAVTMVFENKFNILYRVCEESIISRLFSATSSFLHLLAVKRLQHWSTKQHFAIIPGEYNCSLFLCLTAKVTINSYDLLRVFLFVFFCRNLNRDF